MAYARKSRANSGFGMLLIGIVVGALGTSLYFGFSDARSPIGPGIRDLIDNAGQQEPSATATPPPQPRTPTAEPRYDFFTVLPEIEQLLPEDAEEETRESVGALAPKVEKPAAPTTPAAKKTSVAKPGAERKTVYMLQAASFPSQKDAEAMRARLALSGVRAQVQKVTIENRGTFYRVRLGPFEELSQLRKANRQLSALGIRAMRLKVTPRRG